MALLLSAACGGGAEIRAAGSDGGAVPHEPPPHPDLLIVCVDGFGPFDIAALARAEGRGPRAATPAFDHLVGEGVVYREVYAPSPWAGEALAGLLTGNVPKADGSSAEPWSPSLAELLRHAGYSTALVVADDLHLPRRATPLPPGDDEVAGFGAVVRPAGSDGPGGAPASAVITAAAQWIAGARGPVFLVCTVADPAPPHHLYPGFAPEGVASEDGAPDGSTRVPSGLSHAELVRRAPEFEAADFERLRGLHASEVGAADHVFGRLAQILVERRAEPPVLVAAGLRSAALGDGGRVGLVPSLAPDDLRVPLVVRFPASFGGRERPVGSVGAPASLVDLGPTLLDALGYAPRFDIDGRSLFPGAARDDARSLVARTARGIRGSTIIAGDAARADIEGPGAPSEATFVRGPAGWEPR